MIVSGLTDTGDWRFGKSKAQYLREGRAVFQNVQTRLRSFVNDWFLDTRNNIDWYTLLGSKGTEEQVLREIERVTLQTQFVRTIERLEIIRRDENRAIVISLSITTLYDNIITVSYTHLTLPTKA